VKCGFSDTFISLSRGKRKLNDWSLKILEDLGLRRQTDVPGDMVLIVQDLYIAGAIQWISGGLRCRVEGETWWIVLAKNIRVFRVLLTEILNFFRRFGEARISVGKVSPSVFFSYDVVFDGTMVETGHVWFLMTHSWARRSMADTYIFGTNMSVLT